MFKLISLIVLFLASASGANAQELDPTKPFTKVALDKDSVQENFKLYSVIISGRSKKAMINDKVLSIGDTLGEFKVTNILKNSVILTSSSETIELALFANGLVKK